MIVKVVEVINDVLDAFVDRDIEGVNEVCLHSEEYRIRGLDTGADDYMVKPYSVSNQTTALRRH